MMNAQEIIAYIAAAEKKTPVKVYVNELADIDYGSATVFGEGRSKVVFGDWRELGPILAENAGTIADIVVENDRRNSAIPLLDLKGVNARIEPGAIIREQVSIGDNAVVMMGAILNIGAGLDPGVHPLQIQQGDGAVAPVVLHDDVGDGPGVLRQDGAQLPPDRKSVV